VKQYLIVFLCLYSFVFGQRNNVVPIAVKNIGYKQLITVKSVKLVKVSSKYKCKNYLNLDMLKEDKYRAKHYIRKGKVICASTTFTSSAQKINFNFGSLEIERDGEVINETDKYILIKNPNGKREKIYKGIE